MVDIKGLIQVTPTKDLNKTNAKTIGLIGIAPADSPTSPPLAWVMSDDYYQSMQGEKRNLIKAKVRAIIGTAVFGAGLAIALGVVIGVCHKKQ